jgi:hypothetical protein
VDAPVRSSAERGRVALVVARVVACIGLLAVTRLDGGASQDARAHLRLQAARVIELFDAPPAPQGSAGLRRSEMRDGNRVAFSVELSTAPPCGRDASPAYLFLIDADRSAATGGRTQAVPELGIESKIEIRCDAASRRFVSSVGAVDVRPAAGDSPAVLEVIAPASLLPSQRFHWVALAHDGTAYVRLPEAGRFETWRPLSQWLK